MIDPDTLRAFGGRGADCPTGDCHQPDEFTSPNTPSVMTTTNSPAMAAPKGYRVGFGIFKQPRFFDSESPQPQPQEAPGGWSGEEMIDVCRTLFHMALAFCGATGQGVCYKHGDRPICIPLYDAHGNQIGMWLYNTYCCEFAEGKDISAADDGSGSGSGEHG